jgi:predicted metalloprotease with PDZ domain
MRYLYTQFFKQDRNYGPMDFQKACELMAGSSLDEFFRRFVHGKEELDYDAALGAAGLRLDTNAPAIPTTTITTTTGAAADRLFFGADVAQEADRLIVRRVYAGSPAYEQGLNAGDEIVALDNLRVTRDFFNARMMEKKPGELVNLTIFRFDDLSTLLIKLGDRRQGTFRIVPLTTQTPAQKQIYKSWLGN